jgi:hypothetical protein
VGDTGNNIGTVYEFQEKPGNAWNDVAVLKIGGRERLSDDKVVRS